MVAFKSRGTSPNTICRAMEHSWSLSRYEKGDCKGRILRHCLRKTLADSRNDICQHFSVILISRAEYNSIFHAFPCSWVEIMIPNIKFFYSLNEALVGEISTIRTGFEFSLGPFCKFSCRLFIAIWIFAWFQPYVALVISGLILYLNSLPMQNKRPRSVPGWCWWWATRELTSKQRRRRQRERHETMGFN